MDFVVDGLCKLETNIVFIDQTNSAYDQLGYEEIWMYEKNQFAKVSGSEHVKGKHDQCLKCIPIYL